MTGPNPNYQPPQYEATTRRRGQRLHGYVTNHSGDWKPALHSKAFRDNFDLIKWDRPLEEKDGDTKVHGQRD